MGFTSTAFSTPNCLLFPRKTFRNPDFRVWKRRRLKSPKRRLLSPRNELGPTLEFLSLLSQNWIPPAAAALGFASAVAFSLSNNQKKQIRVPDSNSDVNSRVLDIGEWILFTSPTPFNRFVLLRCPSVSFEGGEFLEDVNDKLVKEERHYVRLDSGRIRAQRERENEESEEQLEYQRLCVGTEDGGVISLDWPANLDLNQEHGLDTTVLLIPGTPEGSMDANVKSFVCECLRRGLFPVVMNPRGCAGSPLTTARLFTAADSDDICSAVQFITKARPWSTFMGVGWGYGANMLTKYLAEAGEKTPLTAATCIDNPFDLNEATRTSPSNIIIDKKLTRGLIDILKSNKELFQGRGKGFDVEKALSAESVRDFEEAISMISYGFDKLEEFYSISSTRSLVGRLKIPVLFIENDDGSVPLFSIPRGRMAENPFTNLLLCSCLPSNFTAISWYHQVTIEWLTAVELGLLKGLHPLLQDIDVNINPSKSLALVEGRMPATNGRLDRVLNAAEFDNPDAYMDSMNLPEEAESNPAVKNGAAASYVQFESNQFLQGKLDSDDEALSKKNGNDSIEANLSEDAERNPAVSDRGQVLQTAQVVMNMLDATMPGTLKEEEKKKVLGAVGRGETLIKALQDAVPEDVCGKLTSSVSEILQAQGKNLNFDVLLRVNQIADVSSGLRSKIKEKGANSDVRMEGDDRLSDKRVSARDVTDSTISQGDMDEHPGVVTEAQTQEEPANCSDLPEAKSDNINGKNVGSTKTLSDSQNNNGGKFDSDTSSKQVGQFSEVGENESDATIKMSSSSSNTGGTDCVETVTQNNRSQDDEVCQPPDKGTNMSVRVESEQELSDQSKPGSHADARASDTGEIPASSTSEGQLSERGDDNSKSKDEKLVQPLPYQNKASGSRSLTFSVSQALDALTGFDDSTQVAVNRVFGVVEDMLTQLEEKENDSPAKKGNDNNDTNNHSVIKKSCVDCEVQLEKQIDGDGNEDANPVNMESATGYISNPKMENNTASVARKKNSGKKSFIVGKLVAGNAGTPTDISKLILFAPSNPYTEAFYREYRCKYMLSKVQKMKSLNLEPTTALFFDYNPEEGHWLLQGQPEDNHDIVLHNNRNRVENDSLFAKENVIDDIIEPSYVILDSEQQGELHEELKELNNNPVQRDFNGEKSKFSVKTVVLDSLKVEVNRRLSAIAMKEIKADLETDMEAVANAIYLAIQYNKEHSLDPLYSGYNCNVQECNQLNGSHVVEAISQAVQNTSHLNRVLPVGVIVGSTLSALRNSFDAAGVHDHKNTSSLDIDRDLINSFKPEARLIQKAIQFPTDEAKHDPIPPKIFREKQDDVLSSFADEDDGKKVQTETLNRDSLMVGAVTAALGASAILSQQEVFMGNDSSGTTSSYSRKKHVKIETTKDKEVVDGKQSSIVTSLAEKAMSVAAPIVPTKEGGEVDQERLVAMLAELGQKGGVLKLVGKLALLWGGLRGAMSLTDRLISFFHIGERPLWQRVLGFFFMALVLWTPVLVPFVPTLFHNWATHNSSRIVELALILGLYTAVTILIMQWGKRIRGHEYPLKQYGLDFMSSEKFQDFSIGFIGGAVLVLSVQSVNALLGFTELSWPLQLNSSSVDLTTKMKSYGQLFLLASQGILVAAGIAFVEELLFRSWLLEEIATDLGYESAILMSALAFSLSQRSLFAVPGLWLLSLALAGARLRKQGSLFIPIGMRTGIMTSNFILQMGGFMTHQPRSYPCSAGAHPSQPFTGVVGLLSALLLAIILYPRQPGLRKKTPRTIRP